MANEGGYIEEPTVSVTPATGLWSSAQLEQFGYDRYNIRQHFVSASGLACLPAAGPVGTPAQFVRLHAPVSEKVITWVVMVSLPQGQGPVLPHWDTADATEVFLCGEIRVNNPVLLVDGRAFAWRVSGEYRYASGPAGRTHAGGGSTPACVVSPNGFGLTEANFSKDFLRSINARPGTAFAGIVFDSTLV